MFTKKKKKGTRPEVWPIKHILYIKQHNSSKYKTDIFII